MSKAKSEKPLVVASGTVVLRGIGKKTEVLVVHRKLRDDWSLPKGKRERNELLAATAFRETYEETGLKVRLGLPLSTIRYTSLGKPKVVRYWLAQSLDTAIAAGDEDVPTDFVASDEVDEVRWIRVRKASGLLSYAQDIGIVKEAIKQPRFTSPLILLRHAEAEKRESFAQRHEGEPPADDYRPLTEYGQSQTPAIADALRAFGVTAVYSSPALRCMSTVSPMLTDEVNVIAEPSFSEWGAAKDVAATKLRIKELRSTQQPLVICSHRPVLPTLLRGVAAKRQQPSRKLKPGDFAVFHRSVDELGKLRKYSVLSVEHSNEAL